MTAGFTGGLTFQMSDGASPEVYSTIQETKSLSGLGKTNPLIDVTSFDSTAREYIAGLADGSEISVECVRTHASPNIQDALIAIIDSKTTRNFKLTLTDSTTPVIYTFAGVPLSWVITPSFDDATMIAFTLKISGDITVA